jgi:hypothetical protein
VKQRHQRDETFCCLQNRTMARLVDTSDHPAVSCESVSVCPSIVKERGHKDTKQKPTSPAAVPILFAFGFPCLCKSQGSIFHHAVAIIGSPCGCWGHVQRCSRACWRDQLFDIRSTLKNNYCAMRRGRCLQPLTTWTACGS